MALASISSKLTVLTTLTAPNLDNLPPANGFVVFTVLLLVGKLKSGTVAAVATVTGATELLRSAGLEEASLNKSSSIELFSISGVSGIISTKGSSGFLKNKNKCLNQEFFYLSISNLTLLLSFSLYSTANLFEYFSTALLSPPLLPIGTLKADEAAEFPPYFIILI